MLDSEYTLVQYSLPPCALLSLKLNGASNSTNVLTRYVSTVQFDTLLSSENSALERDRCAA